MFHNTPRQSAQMLFRAQPAAPGSNAEKLLNLRKGIQQRMRELRDSERTARETARALHNSCATGRPIS